MVFVQGVEGSSCWKLYVLAATTADDSNPALPRTRNIPIFPWLRILKVMQDSGSKPIALNRKC